MSLRPTVIDNNVQLIVVYKYYVTTCHHTHLRNNKLIVTGTKAIPDDIALGVDVDSMNRSPQTSELAETMAKRMVEGIPLT